jgi:hypothetical protein
LFSNQTEVEYDFGSGLSARAGFRYSQTEAGLVDSEGRRTDSRSARSIQNTGIFGFSYRQARWLHLAFGYEYNWTDRALTRTDHLDYGQLSLDYRVGPWKNLSLNGRVALLTNENRASDIDFSSEYRNYSLALNYDFQERINLSLDYSRFTMASDIGIIIPESYRSDFSFFREHTDGVGAGMGVGITEACG